MGKRSGSWDRAIITFIRGWERLKGFKAVVMAMLHIAVEPLSYRMFWRLIMEPSCPDAYLAPIMSIHHYLSLDHGTRGLRLEA